MQLLVDFHYSDTWADPGKQIIPEAWRESQTIDALATQVSDYTTETLNQLIANGARPDMVQVGNETTPGMLIHVPSADTDCWGNNSSVNSGVNGQASNQNWDNLATLFKAGIAAVRAVDPTITVALHIENTDDADGVSWWVSSAVSRGVEFDVLGLSAYTAFQGQPNVWRNTLQSMADEFPDLKFMIAEYNPERTQANQIVKELPDARAWARFSGNPHKVVRGATQCSPKAAIRIPLVRKTSPSMTRCARRSDCERSSRADSAPSRSTPLGQRT